MFASIKGVIWVCDMHNMSSHIISTPPPPINHKIASLKGLINKMQQWHRCARKPIISKGLHHAKMHRAKLKHSSSLRAHMCTAAHHDECQPAPGTENKVRKSCLNCMIYMTQVRIYKRPRGNKASNMSVMSVI